MKSLLLLFFMIPTAVCAMSVDGFEEFPQSNGNVGPFWATPEKWINGGKQTDESRLYTLTVIQQELTTPLQKIQNCSDRLPYNEMNTVIAQLNRWLSAITNSLQSLNSPGEECTAIDTVIKTYANQETSIGQAVTNLEQAFQSGNNSNSVDALQALMESLSVSSIEEQLPFDNLSLGN